MNKYLLHIEGLSVFGGSLYFYHYSNFSWLLFFCLLLVPDISMLGYLFNKKLGARIYNVFHTYTVPILIIVCGFLISSSVGIAIGLIWSAHIGMDRMLGYGLKYPTEFKDTHLNRV